MSTYSSAVLALSPDAYYRCDDATSSTTIADSSGNGKNLSCFGTNTFQQAGLVPGDVTSKSDLLVYQSTSGAYTGTTVGSNYASTATWGIVAWVKMSTTVPGATNMVQWNGLGLGLDASNQLQLCEVGSPVTSATGTAYPTDGHVHQIALVYAAGAVSIMLDGAVVGTATISKTMGAAVPYTSIGYGAGGSQYTWGGNIGDVALIPNLTTAQVATLYSIGTGIGHLSYAAGASVAVKLTTFIGAASRVAAKATKTFAAAAHLVTGASKTFSAGAIVYTNVLKHFSAGASIVSIVSGSKSFSAGADIRRTTAQSISAAATIINTGTFGSFNAGAYITRKATMSFGAFSFITPFTGTIVFSAGAFIVPVNVSQSFGAAAFIPVRAIFRAAAYIGVIARSFADREIIGRPVQRIVDARAAYTIYGGDIG